ncbi:MAG TPA: hypothetical protein VNS88_06260 [Nitrospiraceae bacterium]|nr:hypothetical protein [Nitrospiraceae bacterium]
MFKKNQIAWRPSDIVAVIIAFGLSLSILSIILVTGIQAIKGGSFPKVELSENATQILIAGTGGMTGLLGAYIGVNRERRSSQKGDDNSGDKQ